MEVAAKTFDELTTRELYEILKSRSEIFILEQNILCQDMDDTDFDSLHCFIKDNDRIAAYFRAFYVERTEGVVKIGRVLTLRHGQGLGKELLAKGLPLVRERMECKKIRMDAQKHAVDFYKKFGFQVVSGDFLEEGIVHVMMELDLK